MSASPNLPVGSVSHCRELRLSWPTTKEKRERNRKNETQKKLLFDFVINVAILFTSTELSIMSCHTTDDSEARRHLTYFSIRVLSKIGN